MKDLIKSVINSITVHPMNPDIAVWVCKSLSEVACHGKHNYYMTITWLLYAEVLQEEAVRESVTDCLFTILAEHSKSSKVQMWASYSLYQQVSYNSEFYYFLVELWDVHYSPCIVYRYHYIVLSRIIASTCTRYWDHWEVPEHATSPFKRSSILLAKPYRDGIIIAKLSIIVIE